MDVNYSGYEPKFLLPTGIEPPVLYIVSDFNRDFDHLESNVATALPRQPCRHYFGYIF